MPDDRAQDVTPAEPGTVIGHYEVLGELGRGGMGVLYRARDLKLDREVALKRPYPSLVPDVVQRQRFEREARAAAQLAHPHIVPIFEVMEQDGVPWLAMELVQGRSLRSLLELGEPMPLQDVLRHAEALASALAAAHARGILHRDVNPKNIMVTTDGRVLLTDFGLARLTRDRNPDSDSTETQENDVTRAGAVLGTPGYMSPEQALGRTVDPRSDLFCLGAVLYEMCTRQRAFSASDTGNVLDAVLHHDPPPITRARSDAPPELERIVRKLLSKDAEERYQDAADVVADVRALRRQVEWERYGSGRSHPAMAPPRPRRRRLLATVAALVCAIAAWVVLRPGPAGHVFNEQDLLLIGDFQNSTNDPVYDDTLREGLTAALAQSPYVTVFPRKRLMDTLKRMRRTDVERLDPELSREVAQREGIRVILAGSVRRSGDVVRLTVQALDAGGKVLFAEHEQLQRSDELFERIDALARRVRERLGEALAQIELRARPLAQVTTGSLEALQLFSRARSVAMERDRASRLQLLEQAVAKDPAFAMAHVDLADTCFVFGQRARAESELALAYELRDNVTERERYLIEAGYHSIREDYERAGASLKALVALDPDDTHARFELARAYDSAARLDEGIEQLREVVKAPAGQTSTIYGFLALMLARANREDEALAALEDAERLGLGSPYLAWPRGLALLGRGEVGRAKAEFARLAQGDEPYRGRGQAMEVRTAVYEGRLGDALDQLTRAGMSDGSNGTTSGDVQKLLFRARIFELQGRTAEARQEIAKLLLIDDSALHARALLDAGTLAAAVGDAGSTTRALERLRRSARPELTVFQRACISSLEGEQALQAGNTAQAVERFRAASRAYDVPSALTGLARAHVARREWDAAAESWGALAAKRGYMLRFGFPADWILAHRGLAESREKAGRAAEARAAAQAFERFWRGADASLRASPRVRGWREVSERIRTAAAGGASLAAATH
jgi:eukaryotic-like serine/threonine-protein kinase